MQSISFKSIKRIVLILLFNFFNYSCASSNQLMFGSTFYEISTPTFLKLKQKLNINNSSSPEEYLEYSEALIQYSYGIIIEKADRIKIESFTDAKPYFSESLEYFLEAKKYITTALEKKYPDFDNYYSNMNDYSFSYEDIPYLYWLSASIAGSIKSSHGDPQYLSDLPKIYWLISCASKIDEKWNNGALYSALMNYHLSSPIYDADSQKNALKYFKLAEKESKGMDISIYVSLAESYAVKIQDKTMFNDLLKIALEDQKKSSNQFKSSNKVYRARANWLLSRIDELFFM
jgi:hypothetical protein